MFMPWVGNFREYAVRDGMQIPLEGEVGWEHPEGLRLYFKGKITNINYKFALVGVAPMHMNKKGEA